MNNNNNNIHITVAKILHINTIQFQCKKWVHCLEIPTDRYIKIVGYNSHAEIKAKSQLIL